LLEEIGQRESISTEKIWVAAIGESRAL